MRAKLAELGVVLARLDEHGEARGLARVVSREGRLHLGVRRIGAHDARVELDEGGGVCAAAEDGGGGEGGARAVAVE